MWNKFIEDNKAIYVPVVSTRHPGELGLALAVSAYKHALIEYALEAAQCTGLVQPAFVATHAGTSARGCKWTATFFGFVSETIARNLCGFVFAHRSIVLSKTCVRRSLPRSGSALALQLTHVFNLEISDVHNAFQFFGKQFHCMVSGGCHGKEHKVMWMYGQVFAYLQPLKNWLSVGQTVARPGK